MGSLKEREKGILKISQRGDLNLRHLREDHTDDRYNISPLLKADLISLSLLAWIRSFNVGYNNLPINSRTLVRGSVDIADFMESKNHVLSETVQGEDNFVTNSGY